MNQSGKPFFQTQERPFGISIAGLSVNLLCNDPALRKLIEDRYGVFSATGNPLMEVSIQTNAQPTTTAPNPPKILSRHGTFMLFTSHFQASIDTTTGKAHCMAPPPQALAATDYVLRIIYAWLSFQAGGFLLHAAGVVQQGWTYLFFGHSGSGKTTISRLSAPDAIVLNDDLVLIYPEGNRWAAYATPFWNPSQVRPMVNHGAPVAALFRLVQNTTVYVQPMNKGTAIAELISNIPVLPLDPDYGRRLLERCDRLVTLIPAFRLYFRPDHSFWQRIAPGSFHTQRIDAQKRYSER